jgi:hypothetical protein
MHFQSFFSLIYEHQNLDQFNIDQCTFENEKGTFETQWICMKFCGLQLGYNGIKCIKFQDFVPMVLFQRYKGIIFKVVSTSWSDSLILLWLHLQVLEWGRVMITNLLRSIIIMSSSTQEPYWFFIFPCGFLGVVKSMVKKMMYLNCWKTRNEDQKES